MESYLVLDFDSTLVRVEALDELARIALRDVDGREERLKQIEELTRQGMEGRIGFGESLERRLGLFAAGQAQVNELIELLKREVTASMAANRGWIREQAERIYVVSGGFREYIVPVAREFGISAEHVLANTFTRDEMGKVTGCDRSNPLAHDDGKVRALKALRLEGKVVMVGDGYSDLVAREQGVADKFVAFIENVDRPAVALRADLVAKSFDEVINSDILAELKTMRV